MLALIESSSPTTGNTIQYICVFSTKDSDPISTHKVKSKFLSFSPDKSKLLETLKRPSPCVAQHQLLRHQNIASINSSTTLLGYKNSKTPFSLFRYPTLLVWYYGNIQQSQVTLYLPVMGRKNAEYAFTSSIMES